MRSTWLFGLGLAGALFMTPAVAQVVDRGGTSAGAVIAKKSGEEVLFVDLPTWRVVDLSQEVVPGDFLRTNAQGNLAVLFSDRTQMRLGRNTTLLVKQVGASGADSEFELQSGTIWARAQRGGAGLTVGTAAASAAIRGTDWTMTVEGDTTSLIVLEGTVELANPQGSVTVEQGEAASATIGQAPAKIVNVNPDDREQMLFYFSLRNTGDYLVPTDLSSGDALAERARLNAVPEGQRTAEDWIALAEMRQVYDGLALSKEAADRARGLSLTDRQQARLDLLDAFQAESDRRYAEAAQLFARAASRLDPARRDVALYGGFFARSLNDPELSEQPPQIGNTGPNGAIAKAVYTAYVLGYEEAVLVLAEAEKQYPGDATLPALRARLAMFIDDREQAEDAIDRSLRIDPQNPAALEARSLYRGDYLSDYEGALADAQAAAEIAPGQSTVWNTLGNRQAERGAVLEAVAAYRRSIELSPNDPIARANLAFAYMDEGRLADAKREIDLALESDPAFDIALAARGRYYIQTGDLDKALDDLLAASTANPSFSAGLLLLSVAYYERGEVEAADQALDNADRLDPNDPQSANVRTYTAIEEYQADVAIRSAQEALRRTRARGGDAAALSASQDAGSTLNSAFRLLDLNAWGRFYGDAVFDPFVGSGYVDQSLAGSVNPFVNNLRFGEIPTEPLTNDSSVSSLLQGLLLSPHSIAERNIGFQLFQRPFFEAEVGGGFTTEDGRPGWNASLGAQGFSVSPFPISFYGQVTGLDAEALRGEDFSLVPFRIEDQSISGNGYLTMSPTLSDRVVASLSSSTFDYDLNAFVPEPLIPAFGETVPASGKTRSTNAGLAWSHTFAYRNVLNVGVLASFQDESSTAGQPLFADDGSPLLVAETDIENEQNTYLGGVNHSFGVDDVTFRYGFEAGRITGETSSVLAIPGFPLPDPDVFDTALDVQRAYLDVLYEATPDLRFEAGLFQTRLDGSFTGAEIDENRTEPRVGLSWSPLDGQLIRLGYLREPSTLTSATLAPIGVVGLQSNQARLAPNGDIETWIARLDSEWSSNLFTNVEYQHQEYSNLTIGIPATADATALAQGRLDRVSATANVWLTGGFGAFATYAYSDSENEDAASAGNGNPLPYVPDHSARLGLTYVHPSNVKASIAATYIGERAGDEANTRLDSYWSTDAFLSWEPFDQRMELSLIGYNLLDEEFNIGTGVAGWGRSFVGTLKVRF